MSKVSIISPLYNCSDFLAKTIDSVRSQTYQNWELIIVDDCSQDNSLAMAQAYAQQDSRIKVLQLAQNSGAAVARNAAIRAASGRFIAFLDCDDRWQRSKLDRQIQFMIKNDVAFSFSAYEKIDENGAVFQSMGVPRKISYRELLKTCVVGCLTAVYDTEVLGKIYMPTNTKREDFATWLNILKQVDYAYALEESLAQYRVYSSQSSSKKVKMAKENWRLYRDIEKLSFLQASYYFSHYVIRGVLRTRLPRLARALRIL